MDAHVELEQMAFVAHCEAERIAVRFPKSFGAFTTLDEMLAAPRREAEALAPERQINHNAMAHIADNDQPILRPIWNDMKAECVTLRDTLNAIARRRNTNEAMWTANLISVSNLLCDAEEHHVTYANAAARISALADRVDLIASDMGCLIVLLLHCMEALQP